MEPVSAAALAYGPVERGLNEQFTEFENSKNALMDFAKDYFKSRFMVVQSSYVDNSDPSGNWRNLTTEEVHKWSTVLRIVATSDVSSGCLSFKELILDIHFKALQTLQKIKEVMPVNSDFAGMNKMHYDIFVNDLYKEALEISKDLQRRPGVYNNTDFGNHNYVPIYKAEAARFLKSMHKLRCLGPLVDLGIKSK